MRQKKSKAFIYVLILIAIGVVVFVASRDLSVEPSAVEQPLENDFLNQK